MVEPLGGAQDLRRKRLALAAWLTVLTAANGLAAIVGRIGVQVAIGAGTLLALVIIAILQVRELRTERRDRLSSLLRVPIRQVNGLEAREVGVAPEAPQALSSIGRPGAPEYLSRDIDSQLDSALQEALKQRHTSLIILSGPSKAGKTRALFEAMKRMLPNAFLVAPADADAIDELMNPGAMPDFRRGTGVLWLDDLETFVRIGPHGMHAGVLGHLSKRRGRFVVLATEGGKGTQLLGEDAAGFAVPMADLRRHAIAISLSSDLSKGERQRLEAYAPDAALHIAKDGIGEYMIAAPELELKLRSGSHRPGQAPSPHGQAIALAAIDWRRAGISDPVPESVLRAVYSAYLPDHVDPSDEAFSAGLDWARLPLYSTVALITGRDEFQPYDYVVGIAERSGNDIPESVWRHFLDVAEHQQAFDLATKAFGFSQSRTEANHWVLLAEIAIRKAGESGDPVVAGPAAANLGILLNQRGDETGALAAYRQADDLGSPAGAFNLGSLLREQGSLDEAKAAFERGRARGNDNSVVGLGVMCVDDDDIPRAKAFFREADERGHAIGAYNLGGVYLAEKDLPSATAAFRRAAKRGHGKAAATLERLSIEEGDLVLSHRLETA